MKNALLMSLADISDSVQYAYRASASDTEIGPKFLRITDIVPPQIDSDSGYLIARLMKKKSLSFLLHRVILL